MSTELHMFLRTRFVKLLSDYLCVLQDELSQTNEGKGILDQGPSILDPFPETRILDAACRTLDPFPRMTDARCFTEDHGNATSRCWFQVLGLRIIQNPGSRLQGPPAWT